MEQQLSELQSRAQRANEQAEKLVQQHSAAVEEAERWQREAEQSQRDLTAQRALREQLQDQLVLLRAEVDRASQSERSARDLVANAVAMHSELESRAQASRQEAEAARVSARELRLAHDTDLDLVEKLRNSALQLADGIRAHVDSWARSLGDSAPSEHFCVTEEPENPRTAPGEGKHAPAAYTPTPGSIPGTPGGESDGTTTDSPRGVQPPLRSEACEQEDFTDPCGLDDWQRAQTMDFGKVSQALAARGATASVLQVAPTEFVPVQIDPEARAAKQPRLNN